jgi:hypothetical protein
MEGSAICSLVKTSSWGNKIVLAVVGQNSDAFYGQLRKHSDSLVVAYGLDVALARQTSVVREVVDGVVTWRLEFSPTRTDFGTEMEVSMGGVTPDKFAEMRARRILLDEYPISEIEGKSTIDQLNSATNEVMLRGLNTVLHISQSRFPELFKMLGSNPKEFLETAWIMAVADLKLSSTVEVIERLSLSLSGNVLNVDFSGTRRRQYVNKDPFQIVVNGKLTLN